MELTKAEEQILHYLWKLEEATVQDILRVWMTQENLRALPYPLLFVFLKTKGRSVINRVQGAVTFYYPLVKKEEYSRKQLFGFISRYFDNSFSSLASFLPKK